MNKLEQQTDVGPKVLSSFLIVGLLLWASSALATPDITFTVQGGSAPAATGPLWSFWVLAFLTVAGAVATITRRNPVVAALCLIATLFFSAGLYVLLHATFLAAIQVLVYAGAIMVLFILVVMSVEQPEKEEFGLLRGPVTKILGVLAIGVLGYRVWMVLTGPEIKRPELVSSNFGDVAHLGRLLFSDYLFPFEAISILLLVAIVGAVAVTRRWERKKQSESEQ